MMMQNKLKTVLSILLTLAVLPLCGQSLSLDKPQEVDGMKADAGTAKLIILSTSPNLTMSHEMGNEKGQRYTEGENQYRYELVHALSEDEMEYGGFCKTTVILTLPEGTQRFPITLYSGKCYRGRFQPAGITCLKNTGGVFPEAGKAKVTFSSALDNLTIWCNGSLIFNNGVATITTGSVKAEKNTVNNLHAYELIFTLATNSESPVQPILRVKSAKSGIVDVAFDDQLEARKSYNYSVSPSIKTVKRAYTYAETKAIADKYLAEYASQSESSYFEAASNAIDEVLAHKDCPLEIRDSLLKQQYKMQYIRKYSYFMDKARNMKEEAVKKNGYEHEDVLKWLVAERKFCNNIIEEYPEMTHYLSLLSVLDDELNRHPRSQVAVQTTVHHEYQVISGKVTKNESFIGSVAGVAIYGTNIADGTMKKTKDMTLLGKVGSNGTYRITLKNPYSYLYFYGEKSSRPITSETKTLDVELTRE